MQRAAVAVRSGTPRTDYTVHTGRLPAFDSPVTTAPSAWLDGDAELASVLQDASLLSATRRHLVRLEPDKFVRGCSRSLQDAGAANRIAIRPV